MKRTSLRKLVVMMIMTGLLAGGLLASNCSASQNPENGGTAVEKKSENVFKGKVTGVSKKAKTITMVVGKGAKAKNVMVKFDANTKGMEFAKKGEAAIVKYEAKGTDKFATIIKPKLAKLPEGVSEIMPSELRDIVFSDIAKNRYLLVDSRPAKRFSEGHIPTSISIPVPLMKKSGAELLPPDKNALIIFHCGGPT